MDERQKYWGKKKPVQQIFSAFYPLCCYHLPPNPSTLSHFSYSRQEKTNKQTNPLKRYKWITRELQEGSTSIEVECGWGVW